MGANQVGSYRVSGPRKDRFYEWLDAPPIREKPDDSRFELRKALPSEFDAIYDLIDDAFGTKRQRPLYDWLYRRNPQGLARCWIVVDRETGRLVWVTAGWPWPTARGGTPRNGGLMGDVATARDLQGRGVVPVLRSNLISHPSDETEVLVGWPNSKTVRWLEKTGNTHRMVGPIPRAVFYLRGRARLARSGWSRPAAGALGAALDAATAIDRALALDGDQELRIEEVLRFDPRFDALSRLHGCSQDYWFPRDVEFLNWRYCDHPVREYRTLGVLRGDALLAYCVLGLDGRRATLMEFVAPEDPTQVRQALLAALVQEARGAGCDRVEVFATERWRHWPFLRASNFIYRRSEYYLFLRHNFATQMRLEEWQILPGDHDSL